jgi:hypothetical protein
MSWQACRAVLLAALMASLVSTLALPSVGAAEQPAGARSNSEEERILGEILAQIRKLGTEARKGDLRQWAALIAPDYTEFDPYYPFMLDAQRDPIVEMQRAWDRFDRIAPTDRSNKARRLQLYGDIAILTTTAWRKGQAIPGGPMSQLKSVVVYRKVNGVWVLEHCQDGRRVGPDGVPTE